MSDKIAIFTDLHIGVRNSSKVFREQFRKYFRDEFFPYIKENNIQTILMLGDFFDSRNSVSLHDIDYVMNEWIPLLEDSSATMHVIAGNHDVAFRNTNKITSLSLLKQCDNIRVIDDQVEVLELFDEGPKFVMCPWINNENYDRLMEDMKFYADKDHILCMHAEFAGMKMYQNSITNEHGLDPKDFNKFLHVLSGHFHHPSRYGNVEYIGAIGHYNWQDYDDWRGFLVYDNEEKEFERIENTNCIFEQIHWYDDFLDEFTDEELKEMAQGKIVRVIVTEEHDKVKLKDFIHKLESLEPVSVDVIDTTIVERDVVDDDTEESVQVKELHQYVEDALAEEDQKEELTKLFHEVYNESVEKMKEIE